MPVTHMNTTFHMFPILSCSGSLNDDATSFLLRARLDATISPVPTRGPEALGRFPAPCSICWDPCLIVPVS